MDDEAVTAALGIGIAFAAVAIGAGFLQAVFSATGGPAAFLRLVGQ